MQGQQVAYKRSVTWVGDYLGIIVGLANRLVMQGKQLAAPMLTLHHACPTGLAIEITLSSSAESKHYRYVKYTVCQIYSATISLNLLLHKVLGGRI